MLSLLIPQGFLIISSVLILSRWVDVRSLKIICLTGLSLEFLFIIISTTFVSSSLSTSSLCLTFSFFNKFDFNSPIIFVFDEVSGFFSCILLTALVLCFSFLSEYFEYDIAANSIILLSSLFSQLAFLFFCTYDIISILMFWEWISIVSFFLIQHWSMRVTTIKAGLKVFVISQIGDFFFILGLTSIMSITEISDIQTLQSSIWLFSFYYITLTNMWSINLFTVWSLLLLSALFLKAAQFFFYPWLLDAMEAPVPISAQLHSSTLVIIGFYIFLRFFFIIQQNTNTNTILSIFGLSTAISASILGFKQDDGKRLLACSTAGQLGYVITGFGAGLIEESLILLMFCCCNKAYTFVWFGVVMEKNSGFSDFRILGGVFTTICEKVGLFLSVANSTILPGAFIWHIKSLLARGSLNTDTVFIICSIEVLSITWFFTSLYLIKLCVSTYATTTRSGNVKTVKNTRNFKSSIYNKNYTTKDSSLGLFIIQFILLLVLTAFSSFWVFSCGPIVCQ